MTIDIWLKRIWLVIGVLILASFLVAVVGVVVEFLSSSRPVGGPLVGPKAQPKGSDSLVAQSLTFDPPRPVGRTDLLYLGVRVRDLVSPAPASSLKSSSLRARADFEDYYHQKDLVNIVFTKVDGSSSYPLLEKKAFIKSVDIPSKLDSLQSYNLYDMAFVDTDDDGRITRQDSSQLYISDVSGRNLEQVTSRGDAFLWYEESADGKRLFVLVKKKPATGQVSPEDWPERLCVYDVKSRKLSHFPTNDETFNKVQRLLWEK